MKQLILSESLDYWNKRIIRRLWKVDKSQSYPAGLEFSNQYIYKKEDTWIQVARIDNQLHGGKPGVHIHFYGKEEVKWEEMTFEEAKERIFEIGERIIKELE
jgi:hypothetical protein